jgi:NADH dehydrogenase FAD-containing subunit
MRQESKIFSAVLAAAVGLGVSSLPRTAVADQPETAMSEIVTMSASVQKIDKANRMVTLKDQQDQIHDVSVGKSVNLDTLKVGDQVNATYYEEIALGIRKPGQAAPKLTETTTQRGGVTARQANLSAQVISVDTENNTVTLRGPQGAVHTLKAHSPDVQARIGQLKAGDMVDVTYTQAMAISVAPTK